MMILKRRLLRVAVFAFGVRLVAPKKVLYVVS